MKNQNQHVHPTIADAFRTLMPPQISEVIPQQVAEVKSLDEMNLAEESPRNYYEQDFASMIVDEYWEEDAYGEEFLRTRTMLEVLEMTKKQFPEDPHAFCNEIEGDYGDKIKDFPAVMMSALRDYYATQLAREFYKERMALPTPEKFYK